MIHREECKDYMGSNWLWRLARLQGTAFLASEDRARLELAFLLRVSTSGTTTACRIPSLKDILTLPLTNSHVLVMRTKDHRTRYIRLRFRSRSLFHCPIVPLI